MVRETQRLSPESPLLVLPSGRRGSGIYSLIIDAATRLDDAAVESLLTILRLFAVAGARGAFPSPDTPPGASRLRIGQPRLEEPYRLICMVEGESFDLYGFELLRNMADRLARKWIDIRQLRLSSDAFKTDMQLKPEPTWDNEFDAFPAVSPLVRFRLEGEEGNVGKMRRCLVELAASVEASDVDHLNEWVTPWFDLLEAGAFSLPVGPAWETDCIRGGVSLFDERSIEVVVDRFQASETAWHAVINMLDTCWAAKRLISKVLID